MCCACPRSRGGTPCVGPESMGGPGIGGKAHGLAQPGCRWVIVPGLVDWGTQKWVVKHRGGVHSAPLEDRMIEHTFLTERSLPLSGCSSRCVHAVPGAR